MIDILNSYSVKELKKMISSTNIKGYSKLKKDEIIKLMMKQEHKDKFKDIKKKGEKDKNLEAPLLREKQTILLEYPKIKDIKKKNNLYSKKDNNISFKIPDYDIKMDLSYGNNSSTLKLNILKGKNKDQALFYLHEIFRYLLKYDNKIPLGLNGKSQVYYNTSIKQFNSLFLKEKNSMGIKLIMTRIKNYLKSQDKYIIF